MDHISGRVSNSIENSTIQNLKVVKINDVSMNEENVEQDGLVLKVAVLENKINLLISLLNEAFSKDIPPVP